MAVPRDKDPRYFLFGTSASLTDKEITGSRLPTVKQVVLSFLVHHAEDNSTLRDAANATVQKVVPFYCKARIPMIAQQKMTEEVLKLYQEMRSLMKISPARRDLPKEKSRIDDFKNKLNTTMKFWPRDAMSRITIQEDKDFLTSMMSDRKATMGTVDIVLANSKQKIRDRQEKENARKRKEESRVANLLVSPVTPTEAEDDESETPSTSYELETPRRHKRVKKVGTPSFWSPDVLKHPAIVESVVRNRISSTALSDLAHSFLTATGGNPETVYLSQSSAMRFTGATVVKISDEIKSSWVPPDVAAIHWDGKLMDTLGNDHGVEERLPILVSGVGGVKLLGVPTIPHKSTEKTGPQISKASKELLDEWDCSANVSGMVFDTTSSNTGAITAACISIQINLFRFLLWLACRHHVGEVVLTAVWDALKIEVSKSPESSLFTRFKEKFELLNYKDLSDLDLPGDIPSSVSAPIIALCNKVLKTDLGRGDYKELIILTLLYLGDSTLFKGFQRPGALHKARWMAKILYAIKIVLMYRKFGSGNITVLGRGQLALLQRFVKFVVTVYVPWWLTASVASSAPCNDLAFINTALEYEDRPISKAALTAMSRHMWYLTEELVPLAFFSNIDDEMKEKMRVKILSYEKRTVCVNRKGTEYGKPQFPPVHTSPHQDLSTYIGKDSRMFFQMIRQDDSFLNHEVKDWAENPSYKSCKEVVSNLCVVNDAAERGG